jgi:hypothetical protein
VPARASLWAATARRLRVAAGIVLVLAFALRAGCLEALTVARSLGSGPSETDPVAFTEKRFRRVIDSLPPRGVVGYRPSGPLQVGKNHELEGDDRAIARYVIAQYVLAPRVLVLDLDLDRSRPLVIRDDLEPVRVMTDEDR